MPVDIITFDRAQKLYQRREPIVACGREKFGSRVKSEHVNEAHETVARQQGIATGRHRNLALLHEMPRFWRDRKHAVVLVYPCPASLIEGQIRARAVSASKPPCSAWRAAKAFAS